jgi:hypothetical protein
MKPKTKGDKMNENQAINLLWPFRNEILRDIYDDIDDDQYEAILTLRPGFEYPSWDFRFVSDLWNS